LIGGWRGTLAPGHDRDAVGVLRLGGVSCEELASVYGTPLLVLDLDVVDRGIAEFTDVCAPRGVEIAYAAKAFICVAFARYLEQRGMNLDVCSLGELVTAERAGFSADRLTLHGAGKDDAELAAAAQGRVGRIVVDSIEELERLARFESAPRAVDVVLRLNTGIEAHTHAFVRTGGDDTKFGMHRRDEEAAATIFLNRPHLRFRGVHAHVGSSIYQSDAFVANADALMDAVERFAQRGLHSEWTIVGGGFGVQMQPAADDEGIDVAATIAAVVARVATRARTLGIEPPRIGIEPGRSIVAAAGSTLYRVVARKSQAHRHFAVVDGGLFENPRPALYGATHYAVSASRVAENEREMTLCGRSCENDELGIVRLPEDLRSGELVAMCTTGAYTYSMAGNYNRIPRPAVIAVRGGTHRPLVRRETVEEIIARDLA
jgi:diaminopimelate decarboxylase